MVSDPPECYPSPMGESFSRPTSQGPFRADQLRPGDPYELSHGHPIQCFPTGGRGSKATSVGAGVLAMGLAHPGEELQATAASAAEVLARSTR